MVKYCLDTNTISDLTLDESRDSYIYKNFENKFLQQNIDIYTTEITVYELILWMNEKIHKMKEKYFSKEKIRKKYSKITKKVIREYDVETDFDFELLSYNHRLKLKQFQKQNDIIKFLRKKGKIIKFTESSYIKYKVIVKSKNMKWKNFSDHSDLMVAAICIEKNLVLITNNVKDFNKIDWLNIENWTK